MSSNPQQQNATAAAGAAAPAKNQRKLVGRVTSTKMQKTLVVRVERRVRDPMMGKTITRSKKYHAHVESGEFSDGDLVEIAECRPVSKTKSWKVTRLVEKSKAV
jgi:small subunit ribosomal protein S17